MFLTIIGPNWLDAKDDDGRRRIDNPDDFVTIEIAAALARNIRVIPVLVDGARTPKADKLPDSVKPLVRRNAVEVRNTQFGRDAEALATKVREALQEARPATRQLPFLASAAAWLMAPGQWRTVAGSATALLLVGWIGLYEMGLPVRVPWADAPDAPGANKVKIAADADAQHKAAEAEQQRLKEEVERQAKTAADAEAKRQAAEAEQQRLKEEVERQAKAAADAEAKLKAAEAEQQRLAGLKEEEQRQARAAADAEAKRKATEAEQQRLKEEEQRQARAAADAEAKRKAAEVEQQRLIVLKAEEEKAKADAEAAAKRKAEEAEQQRLAAVKVEEERRRQAQVEAGARYTALLIQANTDLRNRDHDGAIAALSEAIRLNPNFATAFSDRGVTYAEKGDLDRAIADFNEAIRLDPTKANPFLNRGITYARKGDLDRAIADYSEAIRLDPKNARAFVSRGAAYAARGFTPRKPFTSPGLAYTPSKDSYYRDDNDRAIDDYNEAVRLDPKNARAFCGRGRAKLKINDASGNADIAKARELDASTCR